MARSHAIWVLVDLEGEHHYGPPLAAFTVKHELITYLERNRWQLNQLRLFRLVDGPNPSPLYRKDSDIEELDIAEVMK